jgi:Zn-dependent peptidase ImmA (M78 family)
MHLKRLLKSIDIQPQLPLPEFDIEEYNGDGEAISELIRGMWNIPPGPINDLTGFVENAGILVVLCDFTGLAIDGISLVIPEIPPCIFINSNQPADRMRFTLAHELAHIILHKVPNEDMERQANEFASALLMPARDIKTYLRGNGKANLDRFASLKPIWHVAIQALVMRAKSLDVITDTQHRYLWQQISIRGMRLHEPPELDFPQEVPRLLPKILKTHTTDLGYSVSELAVILCMNDADLRRMYSFGDGPFKGGHLRVV